MYLITNTNNNVFELIGSMKRAGSGKQKTECPWHGPSLVTILFSWLQQLGSAIGLWRKKRTKFYSLGLFIKSALVPSTSLQPCVEWCIHLKVCLVFRPAAIIWNNGVESWDTMIKLLAELCFFDRDMTRSRYQSILLSPTLPSNNKLQRKEKETNKPLWFEECFQLSSPI